jgi:tetratricopeptide (TPR) repeat protein
LSESLFWQCKYEEILAIGEEASALIGDNKESLGAALANGIVAAGCYRPDRHRCETLIRQTASFIEDLPYIEELRPLYDYIMLMYRHYKNRERLEYWLNALRKRAKDHGDFIAITTVHHESAGLRLKIGDLEQAAEHTHLALETAYQTGDIKCESWSRARLANLHLFAGRLQEATTFAHHALDLSRQIGFDRDIRECYCLIGIIALNRHDWKKAIEAFTTAVSTDNNPRDPYDPYKLVELHHLRGRAHLVASHPDQARSDFEAGLQCFPEGDRYDRYRRPPWASRLLISLLSGLDETANHHESFRSIVQHLREQIATPDEFLAQWMLEPQEKTVSGRLLLVDDSQFGSAAWIWHDIFGDCSYRVKPNLTIQAANARDLWEMNLSAPRLLQSLTDDVSDPIIQVICEPAQEDRPAIGGLLLWKDKTDYLWLSIGRYGTRDVAFGGCLKNRDLVIGRGRLPEGPKPGWAMGEPVTLRFEVTGDRVEAFCTLDGERWFSVGHATFPFDETVQIGIHALGLGAVQMHTGVHAIGMIDRSIYHGAYPEGTAIRFTGFRVWEGQP